MPTGVAIRDVREQLFAAAERVLLRTGASGLTSRAVTTEAGVAKGVLHKHFTDFDDFLVQLVHDRIVRMGPRAELLRNSAGTGSVIGNITAVLVEVFGSVAVALVGLIIFRNELRARLRRTYPTGVPLLAQVTAMIAGYLAAERDRGRVAAGADVDTVALTLIGSGHLISAGEGGPPDRGSVHRMVRTVLVGFVVDGP